MNLNRPLPFDPALRDLGMKRVATRFTNSEHNGNCKCEVKGAGLKAAATKSKSLHTFFRERCSGQGYH
jgi:hypothetical protein